MGFLDRFRKAAPAALRPALAPLFGLSAPNPKGQDFLEAYTGWVYACVNAISQTVAATDFVLERQTKTGWQKVESHIALDTLNDVNPLMTSSDLLYATQAYVELAGESFWYLPAGKVTKQPAEIWPLDPIRMNVVRNQDTIIGGYVYRAESGALVPLSTSEIIHFKTFNPLNRYRGMGTVQAAALAVDTDRYAATYNRNFFFNNATPASVLYTDGTLSDEQFARLQAQWNANYGGLDNAHKTSILEAGLKLQAISPHQRDMEFLAQRKFSRDEILGLFRVPPTIVSVNEDINRANAETGEYTYTKHTIKPKLQFLADRLNEFYLPLFGLDQRLYRFTFEDPVPANVELDLKRKQTGIASGFYTINEVREEEGLEPLPDADVPYVSKLLVPLGTPQPVVQPTLQTVDDEPDEPDQPLEEEEEEQPSVSGTRAFTKAAPVEDRLSFMEHSINASVKSYHDILLQQRDSLLKSLSSRKAKKALDEQVLNDDQSTDQALLRDWIEGVVLANWSMWAPLFANAIESSSTLVYGAAGARANRLLGIDTVFDLNQPRAQAWLKNHALEAATQIADNLKEEIRTMLMNGINDGMSIKDMAAQIAQFYDEQSGWRALRIARTEVKTAYAQGSFDAATEAGAEEKSWLTSGFCSHEECLGNAAAGWIAIDEAFPSGDSTVPAHPNCMCDTLYRFTPKG